MNWVWAASESDAKANTMLMASFMAKISPQKGTKAHEGSTWRCIEKAVTGHGDKLVKIVIGMANDNEKSDIKHKEEQLEGRKRRKQSLPAHRCEDQRVERLAGRDAVSVANADQAGRP